MITVAFLVSSSSVSAWKLVQSLQCQPQQTRHCPPAAADRVGVTPTPQPTAAPNPSLPIQETLSEEPERKSKC